MLRNSKNLPASTSLLHDESNGSGSNDANEASSLRVHVEGCPAIAVIRKDGSFDYCPTHDQAAEEASASCCVSGLRPFQVRGVDVVGATLYGTSEFVVYSCPGQQKNGRLIRTLHKSKAITCSSREQAEEAVTLIQKYAAWWGRDSAPHLTVFVNPVSGSKKAKSAWEKESRPILEAAGFTLDVTETQRQKHAFELTQSLAVRSTDAIVCVGGDGTMSEIVQALLTREDAEQARDIPLCLIPGGTGNGMSASHELWTPTTAAHALCKGETKPMDILSIRQPPRTYFSFLSITFGLIANVDIGTENLRWMGSFRNQIGALKEIAKAGEYLANVAVLPVQHAQDIPSNNPEDCIAVAFGNPAQAPSLTSCNLQKGWRLEARTSFSVFVISVMPHLALDFTIAPNERVDSGTMTMTHMPGRQPYLGSLNAMLKIEAGEMSQVPHFVEEKIVAFALEPINQGTWLVMDGEVLPYERIFGQIHPGMCRGIFAPSR